MATEQLLLTGVGASDQWSLGAGASKQAACQTPDDDGTSYINSGTSSGVIQMFTLADPVNIGSGDTINSVALRIRFNRNGTPAAYLRGRLVTSGGTLNGTTVQASNGYVNRSDTFTEKPDGGAWTLSALNELTAGVEMTSGSQDLICTTIEVIVDYTSASTGPVEETASAARELAVGAVPDAMSVDHAASVGRVTGVSIGGGLLIEETLYDPIG